MMSKTLTIEVRFYGFELDEPNREVVLHFDIMNQPSYVKIVGGYKMLAERAAQLNISVAELVKRVNAEIAPGRDL